MTEVTVRLLTSATSRDEILLPLSAVSSSKVFMSQLECCDVEDTCSIEDACSIEDTRTFKPASADTRCRSNDKVIVFPDGYLDVLELYLSIIKEQSVSTAEPDRIIRLLQLSHLLEDNFSLQQLMTVVKDTYKSVYQQLVKTLHADLQREIYLRLPYCFSPYGDNQAFFDEWLGLNRHSVITHVDDDTYSWSLGIVDNKLEFGQLKNFKPYSTQYVWPSVPTSEQAGAEVASTLVISYSHQLTEIITKTVTYEDGEYSFADYETEHPSEWTTQLMLDELKKVNIIHMYSSYKNGIKVFERVGSNDRGTSIETCYRDDGSKRLRNYYHRCSGEFLAIDYYRSGCKRTEWPYKSGGVSSGTVRVWYDKPLLADSCCCSSSSSGNQQLQAVINYSLGRRSGSHTRWYENGVKQYERQYENGKLHGLSLTWYPSSRLQYSHNYRSGLKFGPQREWYDLTNNDDSTVRQQLKSEYHFYSYRRKPITSDKKNYFNKEVAVTHKHGLFRAWSADGKLLYSAEYQRNTPVS